MSVLNSFSLKGKTALVTGCKRGIGKAMALALAEAGADIIGVSATLEKHGSMAIYNSIDKSPIISHVGLGPRWIEIPTIYLGLNIFNALALEYTEQKKKRNGLFEAFKSLLILEERAIETGFSHAGVISTELNKDLGLLGDKIIRFSKL
ncbi:hypothetical protein LCGC14_1728050, partial [marine sediment metagenome]